MSWLAGLASGAISSIASMLLGGNLIFDKNSVVHQKLQPFVAWSPIYVFTGGESVVSLHTNLRVTGPPPVAAGGTFLWDTGSTNFLGQGIVAADTTNTSVPQDRRPVYGAAVLVFKQGKGSLQFDGNNVDTPNLSPLAQQQPAQYFLSNNVFMTTPNVWSDPEEMMDAISFYLTGYDDHIMFTGGYADASSFPADKMKKCNSGDMLLLVTLATDAGPQSGVAQPQAWNASNPELNYGMVTGNVSISLKGEIGV